MSFGNFFVRLLGGFRPTHGGFGHQPVRDEAIEYFNKKKSENPDAPLVRIDENHQPAYDKFAVLGYRHLNEREILRAEHAYRENRSKRQSLPSGSNTFAKVFGASRKIHEAERSLDREAEDIQGYISTLRKNLSDLEHLPELPSFMYNANAPRLRNAKLSRHDVLAKRKSKSTQVM